MGLASALAVVELGPGTGTITGKIASRIRPEAAFLAIELNPVFVRRLAAQIPLVHVIHDSAERLGEILLERDVESVDAVISSLPWSLFSQERQEGLLRAVAQSLRPGGTFATTAYLPGLSFPAARRFRELLERHFPSVQRSALVWRNLPPAFVYRCRTALAPRSDLEALPGAASSPPLPVLTWK